MLKYKMYGEVEVDFNLSKFARRLFVNGWDLRRSVQYITKNKNDILKIFSPSELVISKCNNIMKNLRNNDEIVVGIHVRRGDYKTFMDGKYYFSDDEYSDIIFEMQFLLKQNFDCKVKFFIASNEEFILNHLDIEYLQVSNSTPIEDLYLLSKCDYIIGPPSSFSMWASWYGSVPLKVFCRGAKIESLVKFKVVTAIDVFEDGSIITT
jgi:Glycosyl transferase family 11.